MDNLNIPDSVQNEFDQVNTVIQSRLASNVPLIEQIGHHIIDSGGKRLRPLLALLSAKACGYKSEQHINLAAVIEFIHTATLLHDDVVDNSHMRRGQPTANNKWDNASSVLVGDFLYSQAFQIMVDIGDMTIMDSISKATSILAEGEVKQMLYAHNPDISEADYFKIIHDKTATLFEVACQAGAQLAQAGSDTVKSLSLYGRHLGTAFQLIDDVMDYSGDIEKMGKNTGDDLAEGKLTLPLIHALAQASNTGQEMIRQAINTGDISQLSRIQTIMQDCGSLDYTLQKAHQETQHALSALTFLPVSPYQNTLTLIANQALDRFS